MANEEDLLKVAVERHLDNLLLECPSDTILALSVVMVEGATYFRIAFNPGVGDGGPSPELLKNGVVRVLNDYLKLCPGVIMAEAADRPS